MVKVIPTILTDSKNVYQKRLSILEKFSDRIQVDFMDGDFVETESILPEDADIKGKKILFEAHLMVLDPGKWLTRLPEIFSFGYIHVESKNFKDKWPDWVNLALEKNIRLGIALNPETPLSVIKNLNPMPEAILILGVHPGRSGQDMLEGTIEKIKQAKLLFPETIAIDGGVKLDNIGNLIESGADYIYIGDSLTANNNPQSMWNNFQKKINLYNF